jgi:3-deoxy-D-arabino-heptulosonate 7-phosphate (DAHP) synthase class II
MVMERMMTPSEICRQAKQINPQITLNNCSDVLRDFKEKNYVEVLNPSEKTGRLYTLTRKGRDVNMMVNPQRDVF